MDGVGLLGMAVAFQGIVLAKNLMSEINADMSLPRVSS